MLFRLFSTIVTSLFFIASYDQSNASEPTSQLTIPDFLDSEEALNYWSTSSRAIPKEDREAVLEKFSRFLFDYDVLKKRGFDVLDPNNDIGHVFTNISLNCCQITESELAQFLGSIAQSPVTSLILKNVIMTPAVGKALLTLLEGDKTFKRLDLGDLTWKKFNVFNYYSYGMLKRIGMATTGKVDRFRLDQYYSTKDHPFDFNAYDPEWEFTKDASAVGLVGAWALISLISIRQDYSVALELMDNNL